MQANKTKRIKAQWRVRTLCDQCERPNRNRTWSNYCPECRAAWYAQHEEIERHAHKEVR